MNKQSYDNNLFKNRIKPQTAAIAAEQFLKIVKYLEINRLN